MARVHEVLEKCGARGEPFCMPAEEEGGRAGGGTQLRGALLQPPREAYRGFRGFTATAPPLDNSLEPFCMPAEAVQEGRGAPAVHGVCRRAPAVQEGRGVWGLAPWHRKWGLLGTGNIGLLVTRRMGWRWKGVR
jgi:hypothetical protein